MIYKSLFLDHDTMAGPSVSLMLSVAEIGVSSRAEDFHWKQFPAKLGNTQRQLEALMIKTNTLSRTSKRQQVI